MLCLSARDTDSAYLRWSGVDTAMIMSGRRILINMRSIVLIRTGHIPQRILGCSRQVIMAEEVGACLME